MCDKSGSAASAPSSTSVRLSVAHRDDEASLAEPQQVLRARIDRLLEIASGHDDNRTVSSSTRSTKRPQSARADVRRRVIAAAHFHSDPRHARLDREMGGRACAQMRLRAKSDEMTSARGRDRKRLAQLPSSAPKVDLGSSQRQFGRS